MKLIGISTLVLVGSICSRRAPCQVRADEVVAGTYDLLICRGGCAGGDSSHAYLRGILVIASRPFALASLPAAVRPHFEHAFTFMSLGLAPIDSQIAPNGCFALRPLRPQGDSYAGMERVGLIIWRKHGATVGFDIFRSPDAGYHVTLRAARSELVGAGRSDGVGAAEIHAPTDSVYARRIGDARLRPCINAAPRAS